MKQQEMWEDKWINLKTKSKNQYAEKCFSLISKQHKTLLDLGCGDGKDSIYFAKKGLSVTAVDFSKRALEKIPKNYKNLKIINQQINNLKFKSNSFDIIYAHLSLHYFDNKMTKQIFNKLFSILNKNGLIFIKCKSTDDSLYGKGLKIENDIFSKEGHVRHFFSKKYMEENLSKFTILKIKKTSSIYYKYKSSFVEAIATKN